MSVEIQSVTQRDPQKFHGLLRFDHFTVNVNWLSTGICLIFHEQYNMKFSGMAIISLFSNHDRASIQLKSLLVAEARGNHPISR